jgi:pantoate--beta-alanine ligase
MSLVQIESAAALRQEIQNVRRRGLVGFVPTMGALHAGHGRLIETARAACQVVVVSIFVNPLQFDRGEDLTRYPRTLDEDLDLCRTLGADIVFTPGAAEMYPSPPLCTVEVAELADHLCGRYRPGHFRGVATVVLKLFGMVRPDVAYFGEKDAQQLAVVRRMVADLNVPVSIASVPTVREPDGLAMSSRNRQLDAEGRALAVSLYAALQVAQDAIAAGATSPSEIVADATSVLPSDEGVRLEYLEIVDPERMQPVAAVSGPVVAAGALWVGHTRLIDNVRCEPPEGP